MLTKKFADLIYSRLSISSISTSDNSLIETIQADKLYFD